MDTDLDPRVPKRSLIWPDWVLDLQEQLGELPPHTVIVGGAVRDALLRRPLRDLDISTGSGGIKLARRIANLMHGDFYKLDEARDIGRALFDIPADQDGDPHAAVQRGEVDVAALRGSLAEDLLDRDFTVNAMAVDLSGDLSVLIDPLNGEQDLYDKRLRRCGPDSIAQDPIRVLRAIRQSVSLGLRIDPDTLVDVRAVAPRLFDTSPERVRDEWFRMLSTAQVGQALKVASAVGALEVVVPESAQLHGRLVEPAYQPDAWARALAVIEALSRIRSAISPTRTDATAAQFVYGMLVMALDRFRAALNAHLDVIWPDHRQHLAVLVMAGVLYQAGKTSDESAAAAEQWATDLRLSSGERQRLKMIIRWHPLARETALTPVGIHRFWRKLGESGIDVCLFMLAETLGREGLYLKQDEWVGLLERVRILLFAWFEQRETIINPVPLVDGREVMQAFGLKGGPQLGALLDHLREAQVAGEIATAEDALALGRVLLDRGDLKKTE